MGLAAGLRYSLQVGHNIKLFIPNIENLLKLITCQSIVVIIKENSSHPVLSYGVPSVILLKQSEKAIEKTCLWNYKRCFKNTLNYVDMALGPI